MKKNIVIIISLIDKSLEFEWTTKFIDRKKFNLIFILLNPTLSQLEEYLKENKITVARIKYRGKKDFLSALIKTAFYIRKIKPDAVHTHLFDASLIGLIAARFTGVKKRIHTRHNSTFHHEYFPRAVKYDRWINSLSTHIVAISKVVKDVLIEKENVKSGKVTLIPHGFNLAEFENIANDRINNLLKKYNPENNKPVIGIISRYFHLKGIHYTIPAFKKILKIYPNALLLLANASGNYQNEIKSLLRTIPEKNKVEILFEKDIAALYKLFDIFVHVPINPCIEAFGQTYVEALASEVPSVFTLSGIANEFIKDRQNALVVKYQDSESIYNALFELLHNEPLKKKLSAQGKKDVNNMFPIQSMIKNLERLYE